MNGKITKLILATACVITVCNTSSNTNTEIFATQNSSEATVSDLKERIGDYWLQEQIFELACDCDAYFDNGFELLKLEPSNVNDLCPNNEVYQIYAVNDFYVVIVDTESVG